MKAMKQIVVAVSLVVISAMAPAVEAQQGVEKAAPGTLVAPAEALNSLLNMTESQMISLVKAFLPTSMDLHQVRRFLHLGSKLSTRASALSGHWSFTSRKRITFWVRA